MSFERRLLRALFGGALASAPALVPHASAQGAPQAERRGPPAFSGSRQAAPAGTARYEDSASRRSFVLEHSESGVLLKLDDSPEVLSLRATTAQRGDAFLRSDAGRLVLRVTELGNVISYLSDEEGAPADIAGAASPLNAPPMPPSLAEHVRSVSRRLSNLLGRDVTVFGAGAFAREEGWAADALTVTVIGVERALDARPDQGPVRELRAVRLARNVEARAVFREGELVVEVNPQRGYAGRPSSDAIAVLLGAD